MNFSKMHFSTAHFSTAHFGEIQRTFVRRGQIWTMSHVFDLRAVGHKIRLDFKKLDSSTFDFSTLDFLKIGFRKLDFFKKKRSAARVLCFNFYKTTTWFEFWHSFCRQSSSSSSSSLARGPPSIPPWGSGLRLGAPGARGGGGGRRRPYPFWLLTLSPYPLPILWPFQTPYFLTFVLSLRLSFNDSCTLIIQMSPYVGFCFV